MATERQKFESILGQLQGLAGSLTAGDMTTTVALIPLLQEILEAKALPAAMRTQAERLVHLVENIVMGETTFAAGKAKLVEALSKMSKAFSQLPSGGALDAEVGIVGAESSNSSTSPSKTSQPTRSAADTDGDRDLLVRFVSIQQGQLDDLEVWAIELEKGNTGALDLIRRYLHTLKGEFGVLDLPDYAGFIHAVEDALAAGLLHPENLLKLKDILARRFSALAEGSDRGLTSSERTAVLGEPSAAQIESPSTTASLSDAKPVDKELADVLIGDASSRSTGMTALGYGADPSFLADFVAESNDHIHTIETALLKLEGDAHDEESLNLVFRACHTIKGLAGFLELGEVKEVSHAVENLMDRARKHELELRPEHVDVLLAATDCIKEMVEGVRNMIEGREMTIPANLREVIEALHCPENIAALPPPSPEKGKRKVGELLVEAGVTTPAAVEKALAQQHDGDARPLGEILMDDGETKAREVGQALGTQSQARKLGVVEETVRVPVQRLDMLIDAIGEAVIAQSMAHADPAIRDIRDLALEKKLAQAALMMRQIQELSMSLRMVSIRATFQKMARLVRDLSKKMGKQVDLVMEGESTELDKTVVENIGDPLIHMVRNSVDHGVEMPEQRLASGKSDMGHVWLRSYHKAGSVFIEIEDDGKGLDREAILRKAISGGHAKPDQIYSDAEVYNMVFLPGLSTAKVLTDVSGRGVGMDVVKKNIEALRGSVEIRSELGKGSCFVIRLPLTLAIIQGMVVRLDSERYIVPTLSILTTLRPSPKQVSTVVGRGEILDLRGELIRLVRLEEVFQKQSDHKPIRPEEGVVLVVEDSVGRKAGILVHEILDQQQVVIKNLGAGMGNIEGVSGGAIMNDGSVSLIIDVGGVVKLAGN